VLCHFSGSALQLRKLYTFFGVTEETVGFVQTPKKKQRDKYIKMFMTEELKEETLNQLSERIRYHFKNKQAKTKNELIL